MERSDCLAHDKLREMIVAGWMTQAIRVAADLGIAELLQSGPRPVTDLATSLDVNATALRQLLRALCSLDLCVEERDGAFRITEMGALLGKDAPNSLHHWAKWFGSRGWPLWGELGYSVRTGASARSLLQGSKGFEHLEQDPEAAQMFHRALVELTHLVSDDIVRAYDFSRFQQLIDVGGGHGELLAAVLRAHPGVAGSLFDRPHALQGAEEHFKKQGLATRCSFIAGDFFASLPGDADAYLLKSVLHDWNDADCVRILRCCKQAMKPSARLLIVEQLMPQKVEPTAAHRALCASDLHMLVALAAAERDQGQFDALLREAGLVSLRVVPTPTQFSIIEAGVAG